MLPTSTRVSISSSTSTPKDSDALALFLPEKPSEKNLPTFLPQPERKSALQLINANISRGKPREISTDLLESKTKPRHLLLAGLGPSEKIAPEIIRQSAGALAKTTKRRQIKNLTIIIPQLKNIPITIAAESIVSGFLLASFKYEEHKGAFSRKSKDEDDEKNSAIQLTLLTPQSDRKSIDASIRRAQIIADSQNIARTIASRPGNEINPPALAKVAQQFAREVGLTSRILDDKELKRLGMGGILAVGQGSSLTPPRLIVLEHNPTKSTNKKIKPLMIVGKAITFDTGGISIKPAAKMGEMIFDKCGAMAVMGAMLAIAKLKLSIPVVGLLSSAENHISETAYRPGDIIRMYNGVTVEVTNTDAEGRLVLGDALAWGIEKYNPAAVLDLATLTGGCVVALGRTMAGVMGNSDTLFAELQKAADASGEKIWRLPIGEDQRDMLKSEPADIINSAGREASPLTGGAFLSYFIPQDNSTPWLHLDIAGVADTEKELPYYTKGATGWGVRTLVNWLESRAAHPSPAR